MSRPIEDRLRDAYQAKAAQLTEQRLDQLTATREQGLDGLLADEAEHTAELPVADFDSAADRRARHHWIAPALAAAAVAALAIGVTAVSGLHAKPRPRPNPPATHISTPPPSTSAPAPSPSATQTPTQAVVGPPYLPAGQTGSRSQVPWSAVGSGWRLLQPESGGDYVYFDPHLYLYDPAGGRYLITGSLPTQAALLAWSPDGQRALIQDNRVLRQLDLHTGRLMSKLSLPNGNFVAYTRPQGLAILATDLSAPGGSQLVRYSPDGTIEHRYPTVIDGQQVAPGTAIYTQDGSELIMATASGSALLIGNDGHYIRTFPTPAGYRECVPTTLWTPQSFLLSCQRAAGNAARAALIVQPLSGASPSILIDSAGPHGDGYVRAWRLSDGDALLQRGGACVDESYDVLSAGKVRPLRGPAGIDSSFFIAAMSGDDATFEPSGYVSSCGALPAQRQLVGYNMVTGQTSKLLDGRAGVVGWPS